MLLFNIDPNEYQNIIPFPYIFVDNFLDNDFALELQKEILNIPKPSWDRYENPFESKYTLRDKYDFPPNLIKLFEQLEDITTLDKLSYICGYKLILDPTRNFWGVHKYDDGDKLDIHVDAGIHPKTKQHKTLTLGIYLSSNWDNSNGCELEIWNGDNSSINNPKIFNKVDSIKPIFNRLVLFTNNDVSWHGNPNPVKNNEPINNPSKQIFVTISYLSNDNINEFKNKKEKAYFIARPEDEPDLEKDKLRLLRSDPNRYKEIYNLNK